METAQAIWAATLMMFRDSPEGVQVYLQRRPNHLRFAPGAWVFPGGKLDQDDVRYAQDKHAASEMKDTGYQDISPTLATALAATVLRETFEECSVLFSANASTTLSDKGSSSECDLPGEPDQHKLIQQLWLDHVTGGHDTSTITLARGLELVGLRLALENVRPVRRWITPAQRPRRFDTVFFAAELPEGQEAQIPPGNHEAEEHQWVTAGRLTSPRQLKVLPPTWAMLDWVGQYQSAQDLKQAICRLTPDVTFEPLQPERPDKFMTLAEHYDTQSPNPSTAPAM